MDLKDQLERKFLPYVAKPARYLGNEYNAVQKKLSEVELRIALCHPRIYEQGMTDPFFEFLYYALNSHPAIWAERTFIPSPDAVNILRERNIPLFSLESKTAFKEFHVVIIPLRSELQYIDLADILRLGAIPLRAQNRINSFPLIAAGGMWNWNPEPVADFLDVALIGDWTSGALRCCETVLKEKKNNQSKTDLLKQISRHRGAYVPAFYEAAYDSFGEYGELKKLVEASPSVIEAIDYHDSDLKQSFQTEILFPLIRVNSAQTDENENNYDLEAKFPEQIFGDGSIEKQLNVMLNGNGRLIWKEIRERIFLCNEKVHFSLPNFEIDNANSKLKELDFLKEEEIHIFAGAGSARLRAMAKKHYRDDDLCRLISLIIKKGWKKIRLEFRIGYPTEIPT